MFKRFLELILRSLGVSEPAPQRRPWLVDRGGNVITDKQRPVVLRARR